MSLLLKEIRRINKSAAAVLEQADLRTDSDIQSLTREELRELFPDRKDFRLRRDIFEIIHKQKPVDQLLRELKEFFPHESVRAAITDNGVLVDYLRILKDMKTQMDNVQSFLDAHIRLLEEFRNQPHQESATSGPVNVHNGQPDGRRQEAQGTGTLDSSGPVMLQTGDQTGGQTGGLLGVLSYLSGRSTSGTYGPVESHSGQTGVQPQGARDSLPGRGTSGASGPLLHTGPTGGYPQGQQYSGTGNSSARSQTGLHTGQTGGPPQQPLPKLTYQVIVNGRTFDAHLRLLEQVQKQVQDRVCLINDDQDYKITFVFCPISSRVASDVEAAMSHVKGDKPVILVLMHHAYEVRYTTSMRTWCNDPKVVLHVNVFYHETKHGLLKCDENNSAVSVIRNKLLECFIESTDTSGTAQGVGAESGLTGSTPVGGGGNDISTDVGRSSRGRSKWFPADRSTWFSRQ